MSVEVVFAGSGDAFGNGDRFQACIAVRGAGWLALLDIGATSMLALRRAGLEPGEVDAVLVSHFHGDHFGGLPYLVLDAQFRKRTRPLTVAGPAGIRERAHEAMEEAFRGSSRTQQRFEIAYVELGPAPARIGPLAVSAVPVAHTPGAGAVGLRLVVDGRVVAYTGDTEWTDALLELAAGADLLIAEAYSFEKRIPYHLSYRVLEEHLPRLGAERVILTHAGPEMLERAAEARLELASDGSRISLG
jgi:ribonuclease BN (tRNA processing enzyme)